MQTLISKLQDIIKTHYGYNSELEWRPVSSFQSLHRESYSSVDQVLSIPLYEPKSQRPIAFFKVRDVQHESSVQDRLIDLVHLSLQTYINMIDELEVSENLIQYLQMELHPQKIIRLHSALTRSQEINADILTPRNEDDDLYIDPTLSQKALLLRSTSETELERISLALHACSQNNFFIRTDHMPSDFLNSINDLLDLEQTTLFIPRMDNLSERQLKTLETYFLIAASKPQKGLLIIMGTKQSLHELSLQPVVSTAFLKNFDYFFLLKEAGLDADLHFESLNQCAKSILCGDTSYHIVRSHLTGVTKSYNIVPSCKDLYPTVH